MFGAQSSMCLRRRAGAPIRRSSARRVVPLRGTGVGGEGDFESIMNLPVIG